MPTYADVLAGLQERLRTVAGLAAVLDYEPTSVGSTPLVYSLFDRHDTEEAGQLTKHTYRVLHRVAVTWQDNQGAEALLIPYLHSIPAAIAADPRLGGRLTQGYARYVEAQGVFIVIGGALCRAYDLITESFYKTPRGTP